MKRTSDQTTTTTKIDPRLLSPPLALHLVISDRKEEKHASWGERRRRNLISEAQSPLCFPIPRSSANVDCGRRGRSRVFAPPADRVNTLIDAENRERQTDEGGREIVKKNGGKLNAKTEIPLRRVKKVNDAIACIKKGIPRRKTAARLRGGRSEEAWRIKWQDQEERRERGRESSATQRSTDKIKMRWPPRERVGGRSGGGK
ncbi:hypothetical protein ALC57_14772 [Trachymyrmex cornetzi]|uniref:Uncharacterized protein n=1 Tax=Trachymyrmex cornetzi TaxID=471704 RepID=A0A195DKS3_9HYME|nr:hypothetical protein ALC57_14772 [Trachymyrmex cornetzi]